jgi:hypothetical protein
MSAVPDKLDFGSLFLGFWIGILFFMTIVVPDQDAAIATLIAAWLSFGGWQVAKRRHATLYDPSGKPRN